MKKPDVWDVKYLEQSYLTSMQIGSNLEELYMKAGNKLPDSMIASDTLYSIVSSNYIMYNLLMESDLLKKGAVLNKHKTIN